MPEPVSPPPSAAPEHAHTASGQSKFTETEPGAPAAAFLVGPTFGPPAVEGEVGTLGPYRVVKELGKGGVGAVYLALDTRLKRKIALKVLLPEFAADASAKERFLREAQAAAQISHDNVVTVHEADERDGTPYIAMQFLEGVPLDQFLQKKPRLTVVQILRLVREAALGLSAAHKIGLVHRDIKPGNLWLEAPGGRVKVLDFGLARPVHAEHELTQSGAVLGTPAYMSPEQARGLKIDHRTDLFSLGAVMYRLCTGQLPFQGPTTMAVLMALGTEEPPEVRTLNPEIPEPVAALVHQLLTKKPENRPQTADEVVKRIRAIAEQLTAPAHVSTPSTSLPQVVVVPVAPQPELNAFADLDVTEVEPASSAVEEAPQPIRKSSGKGVWIGAGFAALVALVAATVVIVIKNKDGTETKIEVPDGAGVTIKDKSGKIIAQVPPGKQPPASAEADRKAAEYVLSIGGSVQVNGTDRDIKAAAKLPKEPFALTGVNLTGNKAATDDGLVQLKECKNLTHLYLGDTKVTDAGLAHFKGCKDLAYLDLSDTQVTDAGMAQLKECKGLTQLDLGSAQVTDAGLTHFKDRNTLTHLWLADTKVTDAGLTHFKGCKDLAYLDLSDTQVTDAGMTHFKDRKNLTVLRVKGTKVTAKGLAEFHAAVPGCKITHDGGTIEPKVIDDRTGAEWVLSIGGSVQVNGADRELKAAADLPKEPFTLTGVNLVDNKATTDAGLAQLKDCKGLVLLGLNNTSVTDAGLVHFKDCKNLTHLWLHNTKVTDAGLAHFKDCKNLTELNLQDVPVTDAGLAHFKDCKNLAHLYLGGTRVSDAGLAHFKDCKSLTEFDLSQTKVTDAGLAHLKDCKNLTHLDLGGTPVTNAGLAQLKDFKSLKELHVKDTKMTAKGLEEFHAAVPGCKITHDGGTIKPKK